MLTTNLLVLVGDKFSGIENFYIAFLLHLRQNAAVFLELQTFQSKYFLPSNWLGYIMKLCHHIKQSLEVNYQKPYLTERVQICLVKCTYLIIQSALVYRTCTILVVLCALLHTFSNVPFSIDMWRNVVEHFYVPLH